MDPRLHAELLAFPFASLSSLLFCIDELGCDAHYNPMDYANQRLADNFNSYAESRFSSTGHCSQEEIQLYRKQSWYPGIGKSWQIHDYIEHVAKKVTGPSVLVGRKTESREVVSRSRTIEPAIQFANFHLWRLVCTQICPDLLLAAVQEKKGFLKGHAIIPQLYLSRLFEHRTLVEQHLHLGACLPFDLVWIEALKSSTKADFRSCFFENHDARPFLVRAALLRICLGLYLFDQNPRTNFKDFFFTPRGSNRLKLKAGDLTVLQSLFESVNFWNEAEQTSAVNKGRSMTDFDRRNAEHTVLQSLTPYRYLLEKLYNIAYTRANRIVDSIDALRPLANRRHLVPPDASAERHLLFFGLEYLRSNPSDFEFKRAFWGMIRVKNLLYRQLVYQPGAKGLHYFQRIYGNASPFRKLFEEKMLPAAVRYLGADKAVGGLELRLSPWDDRGTAVKGLTVLLQDYLRIAKELKSDCPRVGLTLHFLRIDEGTSEDIPCASSISYYYDAVNRPFKQSSILLDLLRNHPKLTQLLRGFDIASIESVAPNWIFAHVFQEIRSQLGEIHDESILPLRFTAHLGEDFISPITGLRRVHEGVTKFALQEGDRIGHGSILGTRISAWSQRQAGKISLVAGDLLDDLLWQWNVLSDNSLDGRKRHLRYVSSEFAKLMKEILSDVAHCGNHPHYHSAELKVWAKSYLKRFELSAFLKSGIYQRDDRGNLRFPNHQSSMNLGSTPEMKLTREYVYCQALSKVLWRKPVEVDIDGPFVERAEMLQEFVREEVRRRRLVVESCPSSNYFISNLNKYSDLPIFGLCGPDIRKSHLIRCTVSSDDPLTFSTRLANELALLYAEMSDPSSPVSSTRAADWIERLCANARESTFLSSDPRKVHLRILQQALVDLTASNS